MIPIGVENVAPNKVTYTHHDVITIWCNNYITLQYGILGVLVVLKAMLLRFEASTFTDWPIVTTK